MTVGLTPAAEAQDAPAVLVQAFADAGRGTRGLREAIEARLARMGVPVQRARLRGRESTCRDEDCLGKLAQAQQVGLILGSEVTGEGEGQVTRLWLWDAARRSLRGERALSCSGCDEEQRAQEAAMVAGQLLEGRTDAPAKAEAAAPAPVAPSAIAVEPERRAPVAAELVAPRAERRYWTPGRAAAVGLFGGLTVIAFGLGGLIHGVYGSNFSMIPEDKNLMAAKQTEPAPMRPVIFYGVGAGCALGLVLSLALPTSERKAP